VIRGKTAVRIEFSRGLTLLDLLVIVSITTILGALLYPVYLAREEETRRELCFDRIRQLGQGALMYADNWNGGLPPYGSDNLPNRDMRSFRNALDGYVDNADIWNCPSDRGHAEGAPDVSPSFVGAYGSSYLFNSTIYILALPPNTPKKLDGCKSREKLVLYWDRISHPQQMFWVQNVVYADGRVDGLNKSQLRYQVEGTTKNLWGKPKTSTPHDHHYPDN